LPVGLSCGHPLPILRFDHWSSDQDVESECLRRSVSPVDNDGFGVPPIASGQQGGLGGVGASRHKQLTLGPDEPQNLGVQIGRPRLPTIGYGREPADVDELRSTELPDSYGVDLD
jgi:hypothetical protein